MYTSLTPAALQNLFEPQSPESAKVHIFDLTEMPYMDSSGLGMVVRHFARCQSRGIRLVLVGVGPHVLQLLQMTKIDNLIPRAATIEEAN
jgi:anti-anti-sigma factor